MWPSLTEQFRQRRPRFRAFRTTVDDRVVDEPAFEPAAPRPYRDFDPVLLHVGAGGEEQPALRHRAHAVILAPFIQALPVGRLAGLDPGLAQHRVDEAALRLVRGLARLPLPGDPLPRQPANGGIEAGEVKADAQGIDRR